MSQNGYNCPLLDSKSSCRNEIIGVNIKSSLSGRSPVYGCALPDANAATNGLK
jgi:hypothetical protein